jgi:hypothetical protein
VPNEVEENECLQADEEFGMAAFLKLDQQQSNETSYRKARFVARQSVVPCGQGIAGVSESFSRYSGGGQEDGGAALL